MFGLTGGAVAGWRRDAPAQGAATPGGPFTVSVKEGETLAKAVARSAQTAQWLFLPSGDYPVDEPVSLPSGVFLQGAGPSTTLRIAQSVRTACFVLNGVSDVAIRDLVIEGPGASDLKTDGIRGNGLKRFIFERIELRRCPWRAVELSGQCADGLIRNCTITDAGDRGLVLEGAVRCSVEGCSVSGCASHGIWAIRGAENINVIANDSHHNGGQGIELFSGSNACIVAQNHCYENTLGIACNAVRRSALLGNLVENNRSNGIDCNNCEQIRIIGNHSEHNGSPRSPGQDVEGCGILLFRTRDSVVVGNVSINNDQGRSNRSGIQLTDVGEAEHLCTRNVLIGNACFDDQEQPTQTVGIRIGRKASTCPDNLVVGNSLGRGPQAPFGGTQRAATQTADNWLGGANEWAAAAGSPLPTVTALPVADVSLHGRVVLLDENGAETPYVCCRRAGKLAWMKLLS